MEGACALGLGVVSRLRTNANLRYLYTGLQSGAGRPKLYDGKVQWKQLDTQRWHDEGEVETGVHLYSATLNHVSLKRTLRVALLTTTRKGKVRRILLFSTDLTLSGKEIVRLYRARFQIEFLFREVKSRAGLTHCQSRHPQTLHNHWNTALAVVNLAKLGDASTASVPPSPSRLARACKNNATLTSSNSFLPPWDLTVTQLKPIPASSRSKTTLLSPHKLSELLISGGDEKLERCLQDVADYCMSDASFQRILLWAYGTKGTGKSTFAELLQTTLGKNAMPVSPDKLSSRSERERLGAILWNRRLGIYGDAGGKRIDSELLKALLGGDTLLVRHLFQEAFEAKSRQMLLLVSNDAPFMAAYDEALKECIMTLPFICALGKGGFLKLTGGSRLEEVRQNASSPLVREFALWALMGARRVKETGEVYRAPFVEKAVGKFWQETDPLSNFWETIPLAKPLAGVNKVTLRASYQQWCRDEDRQAFRPKSWKLACESIRLVSTHTRRECGCGKCRPTTTKTSSPRCGNCAPVSLRCAERSSSWAGV